ncbi:hypothetical protein [Terracidiphilus gabretensis]|jgi:hypothetical protein|uniref:hypothetical protein n=1 Tax=Terracidiphilus gabretensis TaxID=1577687 RepID=UPI00071BAF3E|nr:hypothetical protein [Terracidiphilus gabretensis]
MATSIRTNVNLEPHAYDFAYAYARANGIPLGKAISELLRKAENTQQTLVPSPRLVRNEYGYLELPATGHPITPEMVKELSEDDPEDDFA